MSFVDKVKSPLDNDEFLKSMILLYARQSSEDRKSGSYIYDELIRHPESEADANKSTYTWNFKKYVEQDTICKLLTDVLGYSKEESIRIYMDLFLDEKEEGATKIDKGDLVSELENRGILNIQYDGNYMEMSLKDVLKEVFIGHGTMGYHVYKSKFGNIWDSGDSKIKFYINAGEYTYEFSKLFKEMCESHDMRYTYKVVNPERDEETRADKMCIYMGLSEVEEYLAIVREIRLEHPEIEFKKPSPLMGVVDGWIGVGSDPDNFELASSYNDSRALLIENSLSKVLGNASEAKIKKTLESNEVELNKAVRAEIEKRSKAYSITKHFVFDDVIVQSLELPPEERMDEYGKNRNKLFNNLPSNERKQTAMQRIRSFFKKIREKRLKKKAKNEGNTIVFMPDKQDLYPGMEDPDKDYKAEIKIDMDKIGQIPVTQEPIKRDTGTQ